MATEKITKDDIIGALQGVIEAQKELIKVLGELLAAERAKGFTYVPYTLPVTGGTQTWPTQPYKPYIGDPIPGINSPTITCQGQTNNQPEFAKTAKSTVFLGGASLNG